MPSAGTPTMVSTIASSGMEPPGTPAVPMAVSTVMATTTAWVPNDSSTPNACARKSTVMPSNRAVPFMFMVAPSGSTKPATSRDTPKPLCAVSIVVGSVAFELEVENAVSMSVRARRKNSPGRMPASRRASEPMTTNWCRASASSTATT